MKRRPNLLAAALLALVCALGVQSAFAADELCGRRFGSIPELRRLLASERAVQTVPVGPSWSSFADSRTKTVWTFAEAGNAAAPAVVCRRPVEENGYISVQMQVRCLSSKPACDAMVASFKSLPVR